MGYGTSKQRAKDEASLRYMIDHGYCETQEPSKVTTPSMSVTASAARPQPN